MLTTISFPGLGIKEFTINPVAFEIPIFNGLTVMWYGILITIGIILAFSYCAYRAKQEGIIFDDLLDIAIFTVIFGVVGARTGFVLFSLEKYVSYMTMENGSFWLMLKEMVSINKGGLQIYGAVIAGAITILVVCYVKKINPLKMLDSVAPAVMIGQIIGRWGNFVNGEAHGGVIPENSPLYFIRMGLDSHNIENIPGMAEVHPTFLYESLWNLVGFIIINALYKKKKFTGQIALMYLSWYGFGRMFIELLRTDQLTIGKIIPVSSVIGGVCFVVCTTLLILGLIEAKKAKKSTGEYTPAYTKFNSFIETKFLRPVKTEALHTVQQETEANATDIPSEEEKDEILKTLSSLQNDESETKEQ